MDTFADRKERRFTVERLIVFDLDGTLIDSVGGIAESVNRTRRDFGLPVLPESTIAAFTGDGARKLLERAVRGETLPVSFEEAVAVMVRHYAEDPLYHTSLYPGVAEGLAELKRAGWRLAAVSNKPQLVGEKILAGLGIRQLLDDNIGGGGGFPLKPAPDAILHLLAKYGAVREHSFVVGDNHTDMNAARNAGLRGIFCTYGFGIRNDTPAETEVDSFGALTAYLATAG